MVPYTTNFSPQFVDNTLQHAQALSSARFHPLMHGAKFMHTKSNDINSVSNSIASSAPNTDNVSLLIKKSYHPNTTTIISFIVVILLLVITVIIMMAFIIYKHCGRKKTNTTTDLSLTQQVVDNSKNTLKNNVLIKKNRDWDNQLSEIKGGLVVISEHKKIIIEFLQSLSNKAIKKFPPALVTFMHDKNTNSSTQDIINYLIKKISLIEKHPNKELYISSPVVQEAVHVLLTLNQLLQTDTQVIEKLFAVKKILEKAIEQITKTRSLFASHNMENEKLLNYYTDTGVKLKNIILFAEKILSLFPKNSTETSIFQKFIKSSTKILPDLCTRRWDEQTKNLIVYVLELYLLDNALLLIDSSYRDHYQTILNDEKNLLRPSQIFDDKTRSHHTIISNLTKQNALFSKIDQTNSTVTDKKLDSKDNFSCHKKSFPITLKDASEETSPYKKCYDTTLNTLFKYTNWIKKHSFSVENIIEQYFCCFHDSISFSPPKLTSQNLTHPCYIRDTIQIAYAENQLGNSSTEDDNYESLDEDYSIINSNSIEL